MTSPCPTTPYGRALCAQTLIDLAAADGTDVHVSTLPPLVASPYGNHRFTCPHGVAYWSEPSSEQIAAWVKDGVL
jgi:hypothetical protein